MTRVLSVLWLLVSLPTSAAPPPVSAYAQLPAFSSFAVSPSGNRIAMLRPIHESLHLAVMDLAAGTSRIALASDPDQFLFNWCEFASEQRLICSVRAYIKLVAGQEGFGYRWYPEGRTTITRLFAVNYDGSDFKQLVPQAITDPGRDLVWNAPIQDRIVSWLPDDPEHVLLQLSRDDRLYPSVYRLNILRNTMKRVVRARPPVSFWFANVSGDVRFGAGYRGLQPVVFARDGSAYIESNVSDVMADLGTATVLGLASDGESFFAAFDNGEGRSAIHRVRLRDLAVVETLFGDAQYDVFGGLITDPADGRPLGVNAVREGASLRWFDGGIAAQFAEVAKALPGRNIRVLAGSPKSSTWVIAASTSDTVPVVYLYRAHAKSLSPFGSIYADIPADAVATVRAVNYKARDGAQVPAYLTMPAGMKPSALPTVILPHGGPYAHDDGRFDYWSQFIASRGYAVLQPNFRGSTGYGSAHLQAGFEQWGERMQDDVIDGLDWLIAEGITDPQRVCIVGGSYGGYVAQVAAYKTPERFRCAVSFAGVSDLPAMVGNLSRYQFGQLTRVRIQSGERLQSNSPLHNVERIGVPLLLVHGDQDRSVFIEQSVNMAAALEAAGKPHQFIYQPGGDHFLSVASDRLEFLEAMGVFLAQHLNRP